jgi:GH35 family endo-1,4-beta-xylanase
VFSKNISRLLEKRIAEIAARYGNRIHSWDVVNESATRRYPLPLPSDYVFQGFEMARKYLPQTALLNINDFEGGWQYPKQVNDLRARGAKIDIMGKQMHLFKLDSVRKIAAGNYGHDMLWPDNFHEIITKLTKAGLPLHFSEITIPAPGDTPEDFEMQAIVAKNLYRLWFSSKPVMGITWWNAVDGCGYGNEPAISGLFTRDMQPKPACHALNQLINHDWKTNLTLKNPGTGAVTFRGFKGKYKITCNDWTTTIHVK